MAQAGMTLPLPIDDLLPELRQTMARHGVAVVVASPGAGKSTRIPLVLANQPWLAGQTILMLEPRRLAARMTATRMAATLGEDVGATVGYRVRLESCVS